MRLVFPSLHIAIEKKEQWDPVFNQEIGFYIAALKVENFVNQLA